MATKEKPKLTLASASSTNVSPSNRQSSQAASKGHASLNTKAKSRKLLEEDFSHVDPDELFVKFTISEIKSIQGKLRAEADAKQEELRVMVGERYRDLLQASTSIMYMANSSKQVVNAFAEIRESITALEASVSKPHTPAVRGKEDNHLRALQLLSAHIKLLLDAPEHLWRLMENREYLSATWIYLLSRVVHRVLITDDPEEAIWQREGINVLTGFPLVQRQWDTIAQMRSQVVSRATLYLRQPITSSEACSAMLSLHLLDSLPLTETLATFLSQRRRTLSTLIAQSLDTAPLPHATPPKPNTRHIVEPGSSKQTDIIHKLRDALLEVLEMIWGSLRVAREVFGSTPEGDPSLIQRSLADIYSDESTLTTVSLLSTLPSSTHLLTLPPSILSYKPYIDLTSPAVQIDPSILNSKLSEWFNKAMNNLENHVRTRMAGVRSIHELWNLRRKLLEKLEESKGLNATEKRKLQDVLDAGIRDRIVEVAQRALHDIEDHLTEHIKKACLDVSEGNKSSQMDTSPSNFVFSPPPIPFSHSSASTESPLKPFKAALRQRIERRTPLLDEILNDIETMALNLGTDLSVIDKHPDSSPLRTEIVVLYEDAAAVSSRQMYQALDTVMQEVIVKPDDNNALAVFIGRLAYHLSSSSCIKNLRYPPVAAKDLSHNLKKLHEQSLTYWRTRCLSVSIDKYRSMLETSLQGPNKSNFNWPSQPSYQLMNTLFYIISSLDKLGLSRQELISNGTIDSVLKDFRSTVATKLRTEDLTWSREAVQLCWDVILLRRLGAAELADPSSAEDQLIIKLSHLQEGLVVPEDSQSSVAAQLEQSVQSYLCMAQTLLSPLVRWPPTSDALENGHAEHAVTAATRLKSSSLLPFGQPEAGQDYRPAIETAKPSARFGLLLVGSTTRR